MNADAGPVVQHLQLLPQRPQREPAALGLRPDLAAEEGGARDGRRPGRHRAERRSSPPTTRSASAFYTARATRDAVGVARETLANQNKHVDQIQAFTEVGTRPEIDLAAGAHRPGERRGGADQRAERLRDGARAAQPGDGRRGARDLRGQRRRVAPAARRGHAARDAGRRGAARAPRRRRQDRPAPRAGSRPTRRPPAATAPPSPPRPASTYNGRDIDGLVWNWSGGFTLAWPIFEGGLVRASVREGNAQSAALRAEVDIAAPAGPRRRRPGAADDRRGQGGDRRRRALAANAKARLDLAELRYRTGVGNGIELSDAQLAATSAGVPAAAGDAEAGHRTRAAPEGARPLLRRRASVAPLASWLRGPRAGGTFPCSNTLQRLAADLLDERSWPLKELRAGRFPQPTPLLNPTARYTLDTAAFLNDLRSTSGVKRSCLGAVDGVFPSRAQFPKRPRIARRADPRSAAEGCLSTGWKHTGRGPRQRERMEPRAQR